MPDAASTPAGRWSWEKALRTPTRRVGVSPTAQHIGLLLATYANADGTGARPTASTLADSSGRSRDTVHRALRCLRDTGWLELVEQGSGAARRANLYRLTLPVSDQDDTTRPSKP